MSNQRRPQYQSSQDVQPLEFIKFLLRFNPQGRTCFEVITQFNKIETINESQHKTLYELMSKDKQMESQEKDGNEFQKLYKKHLKEKESFISQTQDITVCLLYNKENEEQINNNSIIKYYKQFSKQIVILVNGHKQLDKNFEKLHQDFLNFQQNYTLMKYDSYELCYFRRDILGDTEICWFILQETQDESRLMEWIYQGIFRFFDRQFCVIADLEMSIDSQMIQQVIPLLNENHNYFGVQLSVQLRSQTSDKLPQFLGTYYNYLQVYRDTEIAKIKQFHTPFFCFYNWYLLQRHINEYMRVLEAKKHQISFKMNNILPSLMGSKNLYLWQCSWVKGEMIKNLNLAQSFKEVSDLQYQIACCNKFTFENINWDSFFNGFLKCLYFIRVFQQKTSLAFHVFVFMFAPYQIFHQNTDSKVLQVLVAIILPFFLIISLIILMFLPQQFQITTLKQKKQNVQLLVKKQQNGLQLLPDQAQSYLQMVETSNTDISLSQDENQFIQQRLKNKLVQNSGVQIEISKLDEIQYYKTNFQLPLKEGVTYLYNRLFCFIQVITILSLFTFIVDLIITYILDLQNPVKLATFISFLFFIILQLIRYGIAVKQQCFRQSYVLFLFISCNLIVVQLTQIYNILYYKKDAALYLERVGKLGEYLTLTLAIVLTLIIIESQTFYNGYMLLGVFAFCALTNLIDFILQVIGIFQQEQPKKTSQVGLQNLQRDLGFQSINQEQRSLV